MRSPGIISVVTVASVIGLGALYYAKSGTQHVPESQRFPTTVVLDSPAARAIAECRLVGIWRAQPAESYDGLLEDVRGARKEHDPLTPEPKSERPTPRAELFMPDGTWMTAKVGGDTMWSSRWSIVEDREDKLTIEMDDPASSGERMVRKFVFVTPDQIHEVGGEVDGLKYKGSSSAK